MTKPVTIQLTETQETLLQETAAREESTVEGVISELIQRQVDYDARFRAAVEEGLAAVARGDTFSHEEVVARARLRAQRLLDSPDGR
jgi:predicted transcriptional regulator